MDETFPLLPPPPHPASAIASNNPAPNGNRIVSQRRKTGWLRRTKVHASASVKASVSRPLVPGETGASGGSGREREALTEGAVVVTVTVTFVDVLPTVTGFGDTEQVASEGAPVQVKLTDPVNPPSPPTLKV